MWKVLLLIVAVNLTIAKVRYDGHRLFSIVPTELVHFTAFTELNNEDGDYNFWQEPTVLHKKILVTVSPRKLFEFYQVMKQYRISFEVIIHNIQSVIDNTSPQSQSPFDFKNYHTLDEIYDYLEELSHMYGKVEVVVGGMTYENREIKGVRVMNNVDNPGIFIEGGIHAREWIAPATVMYILHEILTSTDQNVRHVADRYNWFFFPVFNPDGYVFAHNEDRLWTKNRKKSSLHCIGTDLNRNWNIFWNISGTSNDPCSVEYSGTEPFSEIEMKTISEYIKFVQNHFSGYFSFHSFSQKLMFPYAYTKEHISNYNQLLIYAAIGTNALSQRYGTHYTTGSISEMYGM
ncbi:hypothetical protein PUN28_006585 [Cardiocondyla obscurior]|uniref:Zinc carboxypeptidase A 1 n=1 Tax=Cardiocondyla obscurior TaxID=286306 RepID=A0AAW2GB92_9HYME